jgi:hypothetical protein
VRQSRAGARVYVHTAQRGDPDDLSMDIVGAEEEIHEEHEVKHEEDSHHSTR